MIKSLEYVENQIIKLKDDLQHYTMVEKDSILASQIKYDLNMFCSIERELKALEIIKRYYYGNGVLFGGMEQEELKFLREVLE